MQRDDAPRWMKIGDAFSQLMNVLLLPRHRETTANESISGRSYRMGWARAVKCIDFFLGESHCKLAYETDIRRAKELLTQAWPGGDQ
jgi:hypothetical protein